MSYQFVFVGSGLSCTYTLIHLLNILKRSGSGKTYRVLILEKSEEFWTGIPYGYRSGENSLIITALKDFIPASERELFITFLNTNLDSLLQDFEDKGGKLSLEWKDRNRALIEAKKWEDIYLPRCLFGLFLKDRIAGLINQVMDLGVLQLDLLLHAEVKEIRKKTGKYAVCYSVEGEEIVVESEKVVLSVGSPPKKQFLNNEEIPAGLPVIEDLYWPSISENLSLLAQLLCKRSANKILVAGSNASALEFFYNLSNYPEFLKAVSKFYVISPNKFPHLITIGGTPNKYDLSNLNALKAEKRYSANDILEAVKKDTSEAEKAGINVADIISTTSSAILDLLNKLSITQQKQFVHEAGVGVGKLQRRAGHEYLNVVYDLIEQNKLEFIPGKLAKVQKVEDGLEFEYWNTEGDNVAFHTEVQAIINCSGFEELSESSVSELIKNLIKNKVCKPNKSLRGFRVNERFEANRNLHVIGPLLAGNINKSLRVWHAESCSRIFSLSKQLAENLYPVN